MISMKVDGLTATIAELDRVAKGLGPGTNKMLLQLAAKQAVNIKDGTRRGVDINGQQFKRLAFRAGKPLDNTGKMLGAVTAKPLGDGVAGVVLGSGPENLKGVAHQFGTGIFNEKGNTGPIKRRSGGRALGPIKTGQGKKGLAFFGAVKGTPVRKWFGFRPGDKEKLIAEASKILDAIVKKRTA